MHVWGTASDVYRRALEENLHPNRSVEGVATAATRSGSRAA